MWFGVNAGETLAGPWRRSEGRRRDAGVPGGRWAQSPGGAGCRTGAGDAERKAREDRPQKSSAEGMVAKYRMVFSNKCISVFVELR